MFIAVHSMRVIIVTLCALVFMNALPSVVRSEDVPISVMEDVIASSTPTTTSEIPEVPAAYVSPYELEGIPGGDAVIGDFVVGPGKVDLTIKPGESKVVYMTVTNRTGERRAFNLTVEDAKGSNDLDTPIVLLGSDRGPYSLRDYISYPAAHFELDQNQRARVPVTITIPPDAEPGGLYGSVLVDTVAIEAIAGDSAGTVPQSAIVARIGTLFFVTIPGATLHEGKMLNFATVPEQTFFQGGPINFGILYENTGSIHLAPYGEVRVMNMLGEEIGVVELDPWFVLPQSERLRELSWNREFLFGRYTATAQVNRSYDDIIDTVTFTFWVLPWKLVLGGFAAVFAAVFVIRAFFRTFEFKRKR